MKSHKVNFCFYINTVHQALEILKIFQTRKISPTFFIKYYLINGFGLDWILEFRNLLLKKYKKKDFKFIIDCRSNYALFICLVQQKFDFLSVKADSKTLSRLKHIAKKNNVTVNPKISIINLSNIKDIQLKVNKYIKKEKT